jgi:hypothetical protein
VHTGEPTPVRLYKNVHGKHAQRVAPTVATMTIKNALLSSPQRAGLYSRKEPIATIL